MKLNKREMVLAGVTSLVVIAGLTYVFCDPVVEELKQLQVKLEQVNGNIEGEALNDPNRCHWMIEIASGCPEPDSYEDTIQVVDCGATLTRFTAESGTRGWRCESGHHGWEFGSDEMQSEELEHEFQERRAEGHYA